MSEPILPPSSPLRRELEAAARSRRVVLFAGLPGVGKSLLLQQLVLLAQAAGREVYLLQWDVTRAAFEAPESLARFPERNGVTHPAIRRAVGLWARGALRGWDERAGPEAILIGEAPIIGNRLSELARPEDDGAERLLAGEGTLFMVPVPSRGVRAHIERARSRTVAAPQHERERADAPLSVLEGLWHDLYALAAQLGLSRAGETTPVYDPAVYAASYEHLLAARHHRVLKVETTLPVTASVYEMPPVQGELCASPEEAGGILERLERTYTPAALEDDVANWYR